MKLQPVALVFAMSVLATFAACVWEDDCGIDYTSNADVAVADDLTSDVDDGELSGATSDLVTDAGTDLFIDDGWNSSDSPKILGSALESKWVQRVAFSPDGADVAIARGQAIDGDDGYASLCQIEGSECDTVVSAPARDVAFSPDGAYLAVGGNNVTVIELASGQEYVTFEDAYGPVAFAPDGSLAVGWKTGGVAVFFTLDALEDPILLELPEDTSAVLWTLRFSADGSMLAAGRASNGFGSPHGELTLWEMPSGALLHSIDSCTAMDVSFAADTATIWAACWGQIKQYDTADGAELQSLMLYVNAMAVDLAPAGDQVAVGTFSGGVQIYDTTLPTNPDAYVDYIDVPAGKAVRYSPDGKWLATGSWNAGLVHLWDMESR